MLPTPPGQPLRAWGVNTATGDGGGADPDAAVHRRVVVPATVLARVRRAGAIVVEPAAAASAHGGDAVLVVVVVRPMVPYMAATTLVLPAVAPPATGAGAASHMPASCCWFAGVEVAPGSVVVAPVLPPLLRVWDRVVVVPCDGASDARASADPVLSQAAVAPQLDGLVLRQHDRATVLDAERAVVTVGVRCDASDTCGVGDGPDAPPLGHGPKSRVPVVSHAAVRAAVAEAGWGVVSGATAVVLHPHVDLLAPSAFGAAAQHELVDPFLSPYCSPHLDVACTSLLRAAVAQAVAAAIDNPRGKWQGHAWVWGWVVYGRDAST